MTLAGLLVGRGEFFGAGVLEQLQLCGGGVEADEARGAEEDDGVLDALAAKAGGGLEVLAEDADEAAVGGVEEFGVLVGQGGAGEFFGREVVFVWIGLRVGL